MTAESVEYIRYRVPEERSAEFLAAYTRAARQLAAAPQCVAYELARCEEDAEHFVLRITWASTEAHLEGFRRSELFPPFLAEIGPYVEHIEEMRHYRPTPVRGDGSAVPTPYDWAGGAEAFSRLTEVFYDKVLKDDLLAPLFAGLAPSTPSTSPSGSARSSAARRRTPRPRAATATWSPNTSARTSASVSGAAGSTSSRTRPTTRACRRTRSSGRRSSPTWSGDAAGGVLLGPGRAAARRAAGAALGLGSMPPYQG